MMKQSSMTNENLAIMTNKKKSEKFSKKVLTKQKVYSIIYKPLKNSGTDGSLAQLGEHLPYKQGVTGSSPVTPTKYLYRE